MSLINVLKRIWIEIQSLFDTLPKEIKAAAEIAVSTTEAIKNFDDKNPEVADILTALIPGDLDNKIVAWLRNQLPILLSSLRLVIADKALYQPTQIVTSAITTLQQLDGDVKNAFLHDLSILIAQEAAKAQNKELKWSDAVFVVEWFYQHKFKTA